MKTKTPVPIPEELAAALEGDAAARAAFEKMPPSHQAEYVRHVGEAKMPETRQRRAGKAVKMIRQWGRTRGQ